VRRTCININSQLDATIKLLLLISISSTCFGRYFRPSSGPLDSVYSTADAACWWPASAVLYTTSCKHSPVVLRMGENIARNMLSWLKLVIKVLLLMHLVGCLYYCINDARSHKHQRECMRIPLAIKYITELVVRVSLQRMFSEGLSIELKL